MTPARSQKQFRSAENGEAHRKYLLRALILNVISHARHQEAILAPSLWLTVYNPLYTAAALLPFLKFALLGNASIFYCMGYISRHC